MWSHRTTRAAPTLSRWSTALACGVVVISLIPPVPHPPGGPGAGAPLHPCGAHPRSQPADVQGIYRPGGVGSGSKLVVKL